MTPSLGAGPMSVRHRRGRGVDRIVGAALLLGSLIGLSGTVLATNLLAHRDGQECTPNVPGCQSISTALLTVRQNDLLTLELRCPARAPAFWNWAADVGLHVEVQLREPILGRAGKEIGATFVVRQQDNAGPGQVRIHLGCSATRPSVARPISYRNSAFGWHPHQ